jgi:hypothetical protein
MDQQDYLLMEDVRQKKNYIIHLAIIMFVINACEYALVVEQALYSFGAERYQCYQGNAICIFLSFALPINLVMTVATTILIVGLLVCGRNHNSSFIVVVSILQNIFGIITIIYAIIEMTLFRLIFAAFCCGCILMEIFFVLIVHGDKLYELLSKCCKKKEIQMIEVQLQ